MPTRSFVVTVLALGMAAAVGLGIARFAYALVLPAMRSDLGWTYGEAGWLNTTNAIGYLAGALLAAPVASALGTRNMTLAGAASCVGSLLACAHLTDFAALNVARVVAGFGGALAFVGGGVLATGLASEAEAAQPGRAGLILGVFYSAPGLGIALSGLVVPIVLEVWGEGEWPLAWLALAFVASPLVAWLVFGTRGLRAELRTARAEPGVSAPWLLTGYFLFGTGYIGYMTFMVAHVRDGGGGAVEQGAFWTTIGCGAVVSAWMWRGVMDRLHGGRAFALTCMVCASGAAVPAFANATPFLFLSAALFGSAFFSVVATTTAFVRRNYPREAWALGIGRMTVAFGVGQIAGPIAIGWLNDVAGDLQTGMGVSAALLASGAVLAFAQKDAARAA